jgi:hypothetical protein
MIRVPSVNPDRDLRIAALEALLVKFQAIPEHRRSAEFIPEKEETVRELLADLRRK